MIGDCGGDLGVRKQPAGLGLRFVHTRADLRFDSDHRLAGLCHPLREPGLLAAEVCPSVVGGETRA